MINPLKIGIVGAGAIVKSRHLPGLAKLEAIEIRAVANSTPESAGKFCADFAPQAAVESSWESLVARSDLDIVWIGAGPFLHEPVTLAALQAGKHVFCQARMATDLASALRMREAALAHPELVTMLCPPPHGLSMDAFIKRLLAEEAVGEVRSLALRSLNAVFLDPDAPPHWRQKTAISGKNIMTLGIHTEVLQRWFGPFAPRAASGRVFVPNRHGVEIKIPDSLLVLADFQSGIQGLLELSAVHPGPPCDTLEVTGSTGLLTIDFSSDTICIYRPGNSKPEPISLPPELDRPWQVEADFIHAVRHPSSPRPHPDFNDGVAYMEVVERVWHMVH